MSILPGFFFSLFITATIAGSPAIFPENFNSEFENTVKIWATSINYRLPQHVLPVRYYVTLDPNLEPNLNPATFVGSAAIEIKAVEDANNITLHTNQLNITESSIAIFDFNGTEIQLLNTSWESETNFYVIQLKATLMKERLYNITFGHYVGILNLENAGFYLAKYYDENGNERRFATTQFQSLGARRTFPCFDEPHMKATFKIGLIRNETQISISNEEIETTRKLENGKLIDEYKETVTMSTYLVALVVSDYKHTQKTRRQRVFGIDTAIIDGQGEYAVQTGIKVLESFEKFLNINYTLTKLDHIAIPDNFFAPGAMENWGLVTYKESYLVYPTKTATTSELQRTLTIEAHELAHQWFGNLVTCSWWRYIWLNEGFANYFQYYIASLVEPSWRLMDEFVLASVQTAFKSDALTTTKPMNYEQDYPGAGPPSWVSYQKSGSVIRMFEHFLTHRLFKAALSIYLEFNAFRPVQPSDLYQALQKVVDEENAKNLLGNLSVSEILETWDSQAGYPVVNVTRNYATGNLTLRQGRFWLNDSETVGDSIWYIPINYQFHSIHSDNNDTTADFWMTKREQIVDQNFPNVSWLIVNKQQTGYYRVNYDVTNWNRLIQHLNEENIEDIHVLNRAQLLDDSFNLARAGQLNYEIPLELSKYLKKEIDYVPVSSFLNAMAFLKIHLSATDELNLFQKYMNEVLNEAYVHLGFEERQEDLYMNKLNRMNVLKWLCDSENMECREKSLNSIRNWQFNNSASIAPNLESPIFCGAMRIGEQEDWNFLYGKYEIAGNTSQRLRILNGLGCSENKTILERYLNLMLEENNTLRPSDRLSVFRAVYNSGNMGLNVSFEYVRNNFVKLNQTISIVTVLEEIGSLLTTDGQLNQLITLESEYNSNELFRTAINNAKENIRWNKKYVDKIKKWYRDNFNNDISSSSPYRVPFAQWLSVGYFVSSTLSGFLRVLSHPVM